MKPERRHTAGALLRAKSTEREGAKGGKKLSGYAATFGDTTDLGSFTEEIAPGAFTDVLNDNVAFLFNHDPDHIFGRTTAGTLRLKQDDRGLFTEVDLNPLDPDAMKLHSRVMRGDVEGMSFSFTVDEGDEELGIRNGKRHRIIKRVSRLFDTGAVSFPAYQSTSISARCEAWANCGAGSFADEHARLDAALKDSWQTQFRRERTRLDEALRDSWQAQNRRERTRIELAERACRPSRPRRQLSFAAERRRLDAAMRDSFAGRSYGVRRVAIHEAGHCVVAMADRIRIASVAIFGKTDGETVFERGRVPGMRSPGSALAGPLAEELAGYKHVGWKAHGQRAREHAQLCFEYEPKRPAATIDQFLRSEEARATGILRRRWRDVEAIAQALQNRGMIWGSDLHRIVGRAA